MKAYSVAIVAGSIGGALVQGFPAADAAAVKEKILHSFAGSPDGADPYAGLIKVKSMLYGTTSEGGAKGGGTVFSIQPGSGAETVLYSFCSQKHCSDGEYPEAGLIDMKGLLYGTTERGGKGDGTVFSIDPATGVEKVVYAFCSRNNTDGCPPESGLIAVKGMLYGTTQFGGDIGCGTDYGCGTVFAIDPATGAETVLHAFGGSPDGLEPLAGLIDVNGTLYGTTADGGSNNATCGGNGCGVVFSLDLATGAEQVVYSFCSAQNCADGFDPPAALIAVNGMLYGTTTYGGTADEGTIFSLDPGTGLETVLHAFAGGTDGQRPMAGLIDVSGVLYGTTLSGGGYGGTVFSLDLSTGVETVLYSFCPSTCSGVGLYPAAGLLDVKGRLYGTTSRGGADGNGTVFVLKQNP